MTVKYADKIAESGVYRFIKILFRLVAQKYIFIFYIRVELKLTFFYKNNLNY